jgi:hypothetical protein
MSKGPLYATWLANIPKHKNIKHCNSCSQSMAPGTTAGSRTEHMTNTDCQQKLPHTCVSHAAPHSNHSHSSTACVRLMTRWLALGIHSARHARRLHPVTATNVQLPGDTAGLCQLLWSYGRVQQTRTSNTTVLPQQCREHAMHVAQNKALTWRRATNS